MPHLTTLWKAIVLSFIINYLVVHAATTGPLSRTNEDSENTDKDVWGLDEEEKDFKPSFLHVKKLFNEGKPFFVEKDPVSGQLDFNHKKSAGVVENYRSPAEELIPLRTNEITPNIHDFLHLPVKYSSSKSVYPLVSTSYANTKYQGSNKDPEGSNHKEYSTVEIQKRPNYFTSNAIFPFEKTTTLPPPRTESTTRTERPTTARTTPTVTTFKPSFPRRPSGPIPTRFQVVQDPSPHWQRTEFPPSPTTSTPPTTRFVPTIPTTTTTRTTYSPTVPTTTEPSTTRRYYESPSVSVTEKVPASPSVAFPTTTASTTVAPITTTTIPTTKKPLVFPTEPSSVSLMEMLNSFADDSNPNVNAIQINENAQPFQRPSGFRPPRPAPQPPQRDVVQLPTTTVAPTTTPRRPQINSVNSNPNPMVNFNDYVKYDIQAPNLVSFHNNEPVSSMNNIKISPDQNVATFVLGSKQSFGGVGDRDTVQLHMNGPQPGKVVGQVFNEPISGAPVPIRFPSKEEDKRFDTAVITGTYKNVHDMPNGHSAPFGFDPKKQQQQPQQHVAFPTLSSSGSILANGQDSKMVGTKIVFESNDEIVNGNSNPFPTREVLPLKGNPNQQRPISTGENDQGVAAHESVPHRSRPPPYPTKYFNEYPPQAPTNQQPPNRPNILPQFRPNTKPTPGQQHSQHPYKESNAYRHPYMPNSNRRVYGGPPPPPPQGFGGMLRRPQQSEYGPPPPQQQRPQNYQNSRFQSKMAPAPPPPPTKEQIEANRRMYKLPQTQPLFSGPPSRMYPHYNQYNSGSGAPQPQASDRIFNVRPQYPMDTTGVTPLNEHGNRYTQMDPLTLKNNFVDIESQKSPPQQEIYPSGGGETKLEPVVTLQMIQTKKVGQGTKLSTLHADIPKNGIPQGGPVNSTEKQVYVVYPIQEKVREPENHPVVIGQRGEHPPVAPQSPELNVASGAYQNTPFTVIHHEQQPILTTLQKHLSVPKSPNRTNFPYQLEQPDPNSASELDSKTRRKDNYFPVQDSIYNIGEQPQPTQIKPKILNRPGDAISAKLPLVTERPGPVMAIAYTPSTRAPQTAQQQGGFYNHHYSNGPVVPEILDNRYHHQSTPPKRNEIDSAYPIGGGGGVGEYEDFQAPFHPSINLGTISDSYQGWAILDRTTTVRTNELEAKKHSNGNEIDRKDKNKNELIIGDFTSESKDPQSNDAFHPELEGGFLPIVPPHLLNGDAQKMTMKLDEDFPMAEKQVAERKRVEERNDEMIVGKDTMVEISAEEEEKKVEKEEEQEEQMEKEIEGKTEEKHEDILKPMLTMKNKQQKPEMDEMHGSKHVEEDEEDEFVEEENDDFVEPEKMKEPERRPLIPSNEKVSGTTEKVMSLGDALSAIFGLDDEGFEEMTTKGHSNEIDAVA